MNEEARIILEFPVSGQQLDLGLVITFDDISGVLPATRVSFDNDGTNLSSTNAESAIKEVNDKVDGIDCYTKSETNALLDEKADADDVYDKAYIDTALTGKADVNSVYTKNETDNLLSEKESITNLERDYYDKDDVNNIINNLPSPMIFKGTLGTGGTITELPNASADNEGFTYKVIEAGTYQSIVAKVGDVFTSNGSEWVLIPAGDEDSDTWRAIKINGEEKLGNAISSGSVDFIAGDNIDITYTASGNKVGIKTKNVYNKTEVDNALLLKADKADTYTKEEVDEKIDDLALTESLSGGLLNFTTSLALPLVDLKAYITAQGGGGTPSAPIPITGFSAVNLTNNPTLQFLDSSTASATSNGIIATNLGSGKYRITGSLSTNASATLNFTIPSLVIYGGEDSYFELRNTANMPNTEIIFKNDGTNVERWSFTPANKVSTYSGMRNKTMNGFSIYIPSSYYGQTLDFTIQPVMYGTNSADIHTITLPTTIYGGEVGIDGNGTQTKDRIDLGSLTWNNAAIDPSATTTRKITSSAVITTGIPSGGMPDLLCEIYDPKTNNALYVGNVGIGITESGYITITDTRFLGKTNAEVKEMLSGVYLVYPLATPTTFSVTPVEITAKQGVNNIFADSGDIELSYITSQAEETVDVINAVTKPNEVVGTLTAGSTSITLLSDKITTDSTIDVYTSDGTEWNSISVAAGSVTITFDSQASDINVKVRLS